MNLKLLTHSLRRKGNRIMKQITKEKAYTPDGFKIVYISNYFFDLIEKEMEKVSMRVGERSPYPTIALRDAVAQVEFRRLEVLEGSK